MSNGKNGPTTYDRFDVSGIEYTDGTISWLEITNTKKNAVVYAFGRRANSASDRAQPNNVPPDPGKPTNGAQNRPSVDPTQRISDKHVLTLKMMCKRHEMPESMICERYGHKDLSEMTIGDWADFGRTGNAMLQEWDKKRTA